MTRRIPTKRRSPPPKPPGWGDRIATQLAKPKPLLPNGITKAGWRRLKVRWGFADACGCAERQEKLNRLGRWVSKLRKLFTPPNTPAL